jgi:hypothetical protein
LFRVCGRYEEKFFHFFFVLNRFELQSFCWMMKKIGEKISC